MSGPLPVDPPPFTVLAVCTGNVCRSPAVEAALTGVLGPGVQVSSAGLRARVGDRVAPDMAMLLSRPLPGFAARQVTTDMIRDSDLVLGMTRAHRAALVTAVPEAVRRTFTLREFAELAVLARDRGDVPAAASPAHRLAAVVAAGPRLRALRTPGPADDIDDPYGQELWSYTRTKTQIEECVAPLLAVLGRSFRPHSV